MTSTSSELLQHFTGVVKDEFVHMEIESSQTESKLLGSDRWLIEIPTSHHIIITVIIFLFSLILKSLVLKFYSNSAASNRTYVLSLVALDWSTLVFVMTPAMLTHFIEDEQVASVLMFCSWSVGATIFVNYQYPTLFLALDRCMVVLFPHKFRTFSKKIRVVKIGLVVFTIVHSCVSRILELWLDNPSWYSVMAVSGRILILMQMISTVGLYIFISILFYRSNKKASGMRQGAMNR